MFHYFFAWARPSIFGWLYTMSHVRRSCVPCSSQDSAFPPSSLVEGHLGDFGECRSTTVLCVAIHVQHLHSDLHLAHSLRWEHEFGEVALVFFLTERVGIAQLIASKRLNDVPII